IGEGGTGQLALGEAGVPEPGAGERAGHEGGPQVGRADHLGPVERAVGEAARLGTPAVQRRLVEPASAEQHPTQGELAQVGAGEVLVDDLLADGQQLGEPGRLHQCAKCRVPVKYMVMPACSATSIDSPSRIEPPGWTTARTPASISTCRPSGNGK